MPEAREKARALLAEVKAGSVPLRDAADATKALAQSLGLLAALCDENDALRQRAAAAEAGAAAMREELPHLLGSHRKWLEASARAGETEAYIEQQGESSWPFRGNGPAAAQQRLAEESAKAEDLHSTFVRAQADFGSNGRPLLKRLTAAEARIAELESIREDQAAKLRRHLDEIAEMGALHSVAEARERRLERELLAVWATVRPDNPAPTTERDVLHAVEDVQIEAMSLRAIIADCAAAIGNGSACSKDASVEFMATVPAEIRAEFVALRDRAGIAEGREACAKANAAEMAGRLDAQNAGLLQMSRDRDAALAENRALRAEVERRTEETEVRAALALGASVDAPGVVAVQKEFDRLWRVEMDAKMWRTVVEVIESDSGVWQRRVVDAEAQAAAMREALMVWRDTLGRRECQFGFEADRNHNAKALASDAGRALLDRLTAAEAERDALRAELAQEAALRAELAAEVERLKAGNAVLGARVAIVCECVKSRQGPMGGSIARPLPGCDECGGTGGIIVDGDA